MGRKRWMYQHVFFQDETKGERIEIPKERPIFHMRTDKRSVETKKNRCVRMAVEVMVEETK